MKKITVHNEVMYIIANIFMAFSVALLSNVNFGLSMIPAPAFILSEAIGLTFGQCEYILQFALFIVICILMRKFKLSYLCSFITGLIYGTFLDIMRAWIPFLHPGVQWAFWLRIVLFVVGEIITAFGVALYFKTYFPPQVYDFFVKILSGHFHIDRTKFKRYTDLAFFIVAVSMTLLIFHRFVGIGWGTVIITLVNGLMIGMAEKVIDRFFEFKAIFPKLQNKIEKDSE